MDKKCKVFWVGLSFALLCVNVFGQEESYPFQVQVSGHGVQSIIFIPGFASSGDVWQETRAAYEPRFTCYTLTMAGFAGVPAQVSPSFKNWEAAIAGYILTNKITNPVLIGHSMGGALALAIAADYPGLMAKIVVVDALPCLAALGDPSSPGNPFSKATENNDCSAMVAEITGMNDEQFEEMQYRNLSRLVADTSRIRQIVSWSMQSDRTTLGQIYCDFMHTDLRDKLANIQCSVLILLEPDFEKDRVAIDDQYKDLKSGRMAFATKGLHFIMYDDTEWFNQQLWAFIK